MSSHADFEDAAWNDHARTLDAIEADRQIHAALQTPVDLAYQEIHRLSVENIKLRDKRLTADERRVAIEALSRFVLTSGNHIKHGGLTDAAIVTERADMRVAGEAIAKLMDHA